MILRRVAGAMREQDWFTVVIEVLIVVVGIFIGLQVDGWNEARKDRIDERLFISRLHGDILLAGELGSRVRERRLDLLGSLIDAADVLFGRAGRDMLNREECGAIGSSHYFNIVISDLSSFTELTGNGRMAIIEDAELRTALVKLQQTKAAIATLINLQSAGSVDLPSAYWDLIELESYFDPERGEVRSRFRCDLVKMRTNQAFLNDFSANNDRYDAYIRDGLAPWSSQFDIVHQLVDHELGIAHGEEHAP